LLGLATLYPSWPGVVPAIPTICEQIVDVEVERRIRKLFSNVSTWIPATSAGMTQSLGLCSNENAPREAGRKEALSS
jgi:hypothetical protein